MQLVYKIFKILGISEARRRSKISGDLISPRCVVREFGYGEKLDVGISHFLDIRNEHIGYLAVREISLVVIIVRFLFSPRSKVHLVDVERYVPVSVLYSLFSVSEPGSILPVKGTVGVYK